MQRGSRQMLLASVQAAATLALLAIFAVAFVCVLVILQGQRDEARRADAIIILYPTASASAYLDHAVDLYQQGYSARLVLAGTSGEDVKAALVSRGVPEAALLIVEETGDIYARLHTTADVIASQQLNTVLLVDNSHNLLLDLKMARDLGLDAYGSPIPTTALDPQDVLLGGLRYWQYVLLGGE